MNIKFLLSILIAFIFGWILSYYYSVPAKPSLAYDGTIEAMPTVYPTSEVWPTITEIPSSLHSNLVSNVNYQNTKFTLLEVGKISVDKNHAETGENVNYTVTIKNTGNKRKFLTHICFNHSGNVTFGCVRNVNIEAGSEFNLNNTMQYTNSGNYSVWITWSQDHTNFYRPNNAGVATMTIL
jgi:hypothetical protein